MIGSGPDTFSWRTYFPPSPGHIILGADSISCPVGQNFLGKCVPPDTSAWRTDFPPTPATLEALLLSKNKQTKKPSFLQLILRLDISPFLAPRYPTRDQALHRSPAASLAHSHSIDNIYYGHSSKKLRDLIRHLLQGTTSSVSPSL